MKKRFLRKSKDKIMGGVCSGLADYIDADVALIRLITLFGIFASGIFPGLFLYLLCIIIVPLDSSSEDRENSGNYGEYNSGDSSTDSFEVKNSYNSKNARYVIGTCLITIGVFLIARIFFGWVRWEYVFAALLIIGGLTMIFSNRRNG